MGSFCISYDNLLTLPKLGETLRSEGSARGGGRKGIADRRLQNNSLIGSQSSVTPFDHKNTSKLHVCHLIDTAKRCATMPPPWRHNKILALMIYLPGQVLIGQTTSSRHEIATTEEAPALLIMSY